jgi:thiol-disulfide isomerase/thioredoxin
MEVVVLIIRILLGAVFGVAALAKLADRVGAQQALRDFGVPSILVPWAGALLSLAELGIAIALIPAATAWWAACAACMLLVVFAAGITLALTRGNRPNCHCFGQLASRPIGWSTLARNLVLATAAAFVLLQGQVTVDAIGVDDVGDLIGANPFWLLMGVGVLGLLATEGWLLVHLLRQNGRLLLRIEDLEARFATRGVPLAAEWMQAAARPMLGLPRGAPAPTFRLESHYGDADTLEALRAASKPIVLVFSDPNCKACAALLPEIGCWQRDYASAVTIALISRRAPTLNRGEMTEIGLTHVLLQQRDEVAKAYEVVGTPSAVLVYPDGTIGSSVSEGPDAIRDLVARTVGLSTPAIALKLPDLTGKMTELADFEGSPVLVLFWNPNCGFCKRMLPDLKAWEAHPTEEAPKLLIVSTGSVEENRSMGLCSTIVVDQTFMAGRVFAVSGTPTAVLFDAEGNIASEMAAGADAVMSLANGLSKSVAEPEIVAAA